MKTALVALTVSLGLLAAILPASAGYVSPDASRLQQALSNSY